MKSVREHSDRSVSVGGKVVGNIIQTGDQNAASIHHVKVTLPSAGQVHIATEIAAIQDILRTVSSPDGQKLANAIDDATLEVQKATPDQDEVGDSLERVLKYAKTASGYVDVVESLKPHIVNAVGWLGSNWSSLLHAVGLSI
jgi:hypothetical protein